VYNFIFSLTCTILQCIPYIIGSCVIKLNTKAGSVFGQEAAFPSPAGEPGSQTGNAYYPLLVVAHFVIVIVLLLIFIVFKIACLRLVQLMLKLR